MREFIVSIEESSFNLPKGSQYSRSFFGDGWKIVTNQQEIFLLISNGQDCCEHWGYLLSEEDTSEFVGAELYGIRLTDTELRSYEDLPTNFDGGDVMFVDIQTSQGTLQFVAYNSHNGYYGHSVVIRSSQLTHDDVL